MAKKGEFNPMTLRIIEHFILTNDIPDYRLPWPKLERMENKKLFYQITKTDLERILDDNMIW